MSRATLRKIIYWTLACVGAAYPFYSWLTSTGLFRWCAELAFTLQGNGPYTIYDRALLSLVCVISWLTALWLSGKVNRWLPLPAPAPVPAAEAAAAAAASGDAMRKTIMRFLLIGSVVAIGVLAASIYNDKPNETHTFEPLNLAVGNAPRSSYVKLIGLAMPSMEIRYRIFWFSYHDDDDSDWDAYIPVLPPHWHPGDPIVYFLHPHPSVYLQHSQPVTIGQTGTLLRDGLPGPAAFLFKKHGIRLGTPPIVLDTDVEAGNGLQTGILIGCGVFLFMAAPFLILRLWIGWSEFRETRRSSE